MDGLSEMNEEMEALSEMEDMAILNNADTARLRSVAYAAVRGSLPATATNVEISNVAEAFVRMARNDWNSPYTTAAVMASPLFQVQVNNWRAGKGLSVVSPSATGDGYGGSEDTILGIKKRYVIYGALGLAALVAYRKFRS